MNSIKVFIALVILLLLFNPGNLTESQAQVVYRLNWAKEVFISGSGIAIGILGKNLNQDLMPLSEEEIANLSRLEVNKFDRSATYLYSGNARRMSDVLVACSVILPLSLFTQTEIRQDWETVGAMYLETMLFSNVVPLISKGRVKRIRPYVYNDNVPLEEKLDKNALRSFYSGHTTNAFASAVFVSTVYGRYYPQSRYKPYIWVGSLSLASLVGYLRYKAGKHFPSDILTGAAVGSTIGFIIPYVHRIGKSKNISLRVTRTVHTMVIGINITV